MTGQVHQFKFKIPEKCEIDVELTIDNDKPISIDKIGELVDEVHEQLYYSLVNMSE